MKQSKFVLRREKNTFCDGNVACFSKVVAVFDDFQDAMDAFYRGAKRWGMGLSFDNSIKPSMGFMFCQIYLQVGEWRYFITQDVNPYDIFEGIFD